MTFRFASSLLIAALALTSCGNNGGGSFKYDEVELIEYDNCLSSESEQWNLALTEGNIQRIELPAINAPVPGVGDTSLLRPIEVGKGEGLYLEKGYILCVGYIGNGPAAVSGVSRQPRSGAAHAADRRRRLCRDDRRDQGHAGLHGRDHRGNGGVEMEARQDFTDAVDVEHPRPRLWRVDHLVPRRAFHPDQTNADLRRDEIVWIEPGEGPKNEWLEFS